VAIDRVQFQYVLLFQSDSFFFSSRRRHTRCLSDWSSDVCSSDLPLMMTIFTIKAGKLEPIAIIKGGKTIKFDDFIAQTDADKKRSEERRVGKECRAQL